MCTAIAPLILVVASALPDAGKIDLSHATVVAREDGAPVAEKTAVTVLVEEAEKRTGIRWTLQTHWPQTGAVIVATSKLDDVAGGQKAPEVVRRSAAGSKPEGFVLAVAAGLADQPVVWIVGADARGVLFGVGKLLRTLEMTRGSATLDARTNIATSPAYPIRGHQLGYRNRANSWDAWDVKQFDQYIRELAICGANCVENIPFEDASRSPHMRVPRKEMNVRMSEICQRYDQDYWVWTPADFDLNDDAKRTQALRDHEELYQTCPRLDGIFFPGGDPGNNPPNLVLPFLKDLSVLLAKYHPRAKIWLSLQGFRGDRAEFVYKYLDEEKLDWFGGVVCGPGSPPIPATRTRLNPRYPIRSYPDITHNVRCQYPVLWWDPVFAFTLGREAINPRPVQYAAIHNALAPYTAGFLSYSDGVHDDVNKVVWTLLAWDPEMRVRDILIDYARFFFAPEVAEQAADGILALEKNWTGSLRDNGAVEGTLALWENLEQKESQLAGNWRWQMCLLRAVYDAYTRHRLIYESVLEEEADAALAQAPSRGSQAAMDAALAILNRAQTDRARPDLRRRIGELRKALFRSIGLQTSVPKYQASEAERGCILNFVDYPLNNRWWLEDEFTAVGKLPSEPEKLARLELLRTWDHPGPGSFYDNLGNIGKAPHVVAGDITTTAGPSRPRMPNPSVLWVNQGASRRKPAWQITLGLPVSLRYSGLDSHAHYVIRTSAGGSGLLSVNGERVEPTADNKAGVEFKEFPVPQHLIKDGTLLLTIERSGEFVGRRDGPRLTEVWLLKK